MHAARQWQWQCDLAACERDGGTPSAFFRCFCRRLRLFPLCVRVISRCRRRPVASSNSHLPFFLYRLLLFLSLRLVLYYYMIQHNVEDTLTSATAVCLCVTVLCYVQTAAFFCYYPTWMIPVAALPPLSFSLIMIIMIITAIAAPICTCALLLFLILLFILVDY